LRLQPLLLVAVLGLEALLRKAPTFQDHQDPNEGSDSMTNHLYDNSNHIIFRNRRPDLLLPTLR